MGIKDKQANTSGSVRNKRKLEQDISKDSSSDISDCSVEVESESEQEDSEQEDSEQEDSTEDIDSQTLPTESVEDTESSSLYANNKDDNSASEKKMEQKLLKEQRKASKPEYQMISTLKKKWEVFRRGDIDTAQRQVVLVEAMLLIKGKIKDVTFKHDCSRIIQSILKRGNMEQRNIIAEELKDSYPSLTNAKYGKFIIMGILKYCPIYRQKVISSFYGNVRKMIKQKESATIIEECYSIWANATQQSRLAQEFYGPEFAIFGAPNALNGSKNTVLSVASIVSSNPEKKPIILKNLKQAIETLINKDHVHLSIVHKCILEYVLNANLTEIQELVSIMRDIIVEILHTKDGAKAGAICFFYATSKDRKYILKTFKQYTLKISSEEYGHWAILAAFESMDDTVFMRKSVLPDISSIVNDLANDRFGRRVLLYLLCGRDRRYIGSDAISLLKSGDSIRQQTCKKDDNLRRSELLDGISSNLLKWAEKNGNNAIYIPFESQLLVETILHCPGDKSAIIQSISNAITESQESTITTDADMDTLPDNHIFMNMTSSRAISNLLKAERRENDLKNSSNSAKPQESENKINFAPILLDKILEYPDLLTKMAKSGVFIVVHLLESPLTSEKTKVELKSSLRNPKQKLVKYNKPAESAPKPETSAKNNKFKKNKPNPAKDKIQQTAIDIMIKLLS
ncbi:hypothetical protein BB561_005761 [Smittium simulii]|uniref:CPL domain-containing protein n=1 Tax=Smittium simulii TaxID=133385 RepID=A0A2T9Y8I0_9FUNG|nr:hypothetical protein BB561_005761 [Smittium simulii]